MAGLVLYCVTVCVLVMDVECVTVSSVVFMEGKDRQCSVASLVMYCVTVCILVYGVESVTISKVVFKEETDKKCSVTGLVLYSVTVCILVWVLSVLLSAMLCLWKEQTDSAVWQSYCCIV